MKGKVLVQILLLFFFAGVFQLHADVTFWADAESGAAFTGYNDVQIPADSGTRLLLSEDLSVDPVWFYRLQAGVEIGRHALFGLYAPLLVESRGSLNTPVEFYGETFAADTDLTATYKFNSYRLTYAYTFLENDSWRLAAGLTGKIRDAYISLENDSRKAKRTDLGFVPLIHLSARWYLTPSFSLLLEGEGLAAPQGRAEDFLLATVFAPREDLELRLGYRVLEGGSDGGGSVYTFSLFHYLSAGLRWRYNIN